MKSSILVLGVAACIAVGFVACGGDDSNGGTSDAGSGDSATAEPDGSDDLDSSSTDGTSPGTDASDAGRTDAAGDSGGPTFVDGSVPNGGNPSTPNVIDCGGKACSSTTASCCSPSVPDGGAFSCGDPDGSTCPGVTQECDETADCPSGQVCCAVVTDGPYVETTCLESCQIRAESRQACKLNGECHNGNPCMPQTCSGQLIGLCSPGGDTCH